MATLLESEFVPEDLLVAVVDDDELVRTSMGGLLRSLGMTTKMYRSADALLTDNPGEFDLIVSDFQMPGTNGLKLREIVNKRYDVPIIIVTAFPERVISLCRDRAPLHLIEKPVDSAALIACIETLFGGRAS